MPTNNTPIESLVAVSAEESDALIAHVMLATSYFIGNYHKVAVWNPNETAELTAQAMRVFQGEASLAAVNGANVALDKPLVQAFKREFITPDMFTNCGAMIVAVEPLGYAGEEPWVEHTYVLVNHSTRDGDNTWRDAFDYGADRIRFGNLPASDYRPATAEEIQEAVAAIAASPDGLKFRNLLLKGKDPTPTA